MYILAHYSLLSVLSPFYGWINFIVFFSQFVDDQEFWGGSLGGQLFLQANPDADNPVLSFSVALR